MTNTPESNQPLNEQRDFIRKYKTFISLMDESFHSFYNTISSGGASDFSFEANYDLEEDRKKYRELEGEAGSFWIDLIAPLEERRKDYALRVAFVVLLDDQGRHQKPVYEINAWGEIDEEEAGKIADRARSSANPDVPSKLEIDIEGKRSDELAQKLDSALDFLTPNVFE